MPNPKPKELRPFSAEACPMPPQAAAAMLGALSEPAMLLDERGRILACNQALAGDAQSTIEELRGTTVTEALKLSPEDSRALLRAAFGSPSSTLAGVRGSRGDRKEKLLFECARLDSIRSSAGSLAFVRLPLASGMVQRCNELTRSVQETRAQSSQLKSERIALRQEIEELRSEVITDQLTKLPNRRAFVEHLGKVAGDSARERTPLTVLMIDIDDFKSVNDLWGHAKGDECLREIAAALSTVARRPLDLVARIGGEEFAILLPKCDYRAALDRATAAGQALRRARSPHPTSSSGFTTVSVGMACAVLRTGTPFAWLVEEADRALYQAKERGKNRIAVARIPRALAARPKNC